MTALIDAGGPDAVGIYYGNPAGFSSSNIIFMNGWLDAIGTHSRYSVGSRGGGAPESFGANRNLLVDGGPADPLSQTSALSSSYVGVERVG